MPLPGSSFGKANDDTHFMHTFSIKVINSEVTAAVRKELTKSHLRFYAVAQCNGITKSTKAVGGEWSSSTKIAYWWNETFHFSFQGGRNDGIEFAIDLYQIGGAQNNGDKWLGRARATLIKSIRNKDIHQELAEGGCSISFRVGDTVAVAYRNTELRMFALIIGINEYLSKDIPDLAGSVGDAKDMQDFLENDLRLPKSNICTLYNENATRQNIISCFKTHLMENKRIANGGNDSIVIFFAGHGNRALAPEGWPATSDGYIEVICSNDYLQPDRQNGGLVNALPDRTVNALVRSLAEIKGNNITLIFDSCHSGGIGRDVLLPGEGYRTFNHLSWRPVIPGDLDRNIWSTHRTSARFRYKDMESSVLLAACSQNEVAHEGFSGNRPRGVFTVALLRKLRELNRSGTLMSISYAQLIQSLQPLRDDQTPQCEGEFKRSPLFTAKPTPPATYFPLTKVKDYEYAELYEVPLGTFHGVTGTTQFRARVIGNDQRELGLILQPREVSGFTSIFQISKERPHVIRNGTEVSIWNWNNEQMKLRIFLDFTDTKYGEKPLPSINRNSKPQSAINTATRKQYLQKTVEDALRSDNFEQPTGSFYRVYTIAATRMDPGAHISVRIDDDKQFTIKRCLNFLPPFLDVKGVEEHPCTDPLYKESYGRLRLLQILDGIYLFRYHLLRDLAEHPRLKVGTGSPNTIDSVQLHLFYLSHNRYGVLSPITGNDLFTTQRRATIHSSDLTRSFFGFEITNRYDNDLYLYLLWFDPDCYSIEPWYLPQNTSDILKQNESLTIGYGARGGDPFIFSLPKDSSESTGFLKLFVSTKYVDNMDSISQPSVFETNTGRMGIRKSTLVARDMYVSMVAKIDIIP